MKSETVQYLELIRDYILLEVTFLQSGYVGSFKDRDGEVYFRSAGDSQELDEAGPDDTQGNYFYIRFKEREQAIIESEQLQVGPHERQKEILELRLVAIFEGANMFEVLADLQTALLHISLPPFSNVDSPEVRQRSWYVDYLNGDTSDVNEQERGYSNDTLSLALDFELSFYRSGDCRAEYQP